jgi:hypothetical protein
VEAGESYRIMTVQYGNNCMNQGKVYEWVGRFKGGQLSVVDGACSE